MRDIDDFDRSFRRTQRFVSWGIGVTFLITVAGVALVGWAVWHVAHLGPDGITAAFGRAVKTFNEASH